MLCNLNSKYLILLLNQHVFKEWMAKILPKFLKIFNSESNSLSMLIEITQCWNLHCVANIELLLRLPPNRQPRASFFVLFNLKFAWVKAEYFRSFSKQLWKHSDFQVLGAMKWVVRCIHEHTLFSRMLMHIHEKLDTTWILPKESLDELFDSVNFRHQFHIWVKVAPVQVFA